MILEIDKSGGSIADTRRKKHRHCRNGEEKTQVEERGLERDEAEEGV